jgi:UDP-N-acetylglucosamine 2-epimerase (non-hydrolysing)
MAPVVAELQRRLPSVRHVVVDTGQHYDRMMSAIFREQLSVPDPDYVLGVGSGTHAQQTARVMERLEPVLEMEKPDLVIVPGDVNSTLAAALVAAKLMIPLAHLESGLRSFDRAMPEEINRIIADQLSDHLFIHSAEAESNLAREGIPADRVHFVGNTMIDSLVTMAPQFRQMDAAARLGLPRGGYLLVTLHRPALVDGPLLADVLTELSVIAHELPVVFPAHPRTRKLIDQVELDPNVRVIDPVGYLEFLSLQVDAAGVLTDSGGVQEETTFLGIPCFTLRDNTERPVTVTAGTNTLLGLDPSQIGTILPALRQPAAGKGERSKVHPAPSGWDGHAASRVADVVEKALDANTRMTIPV